jgi:hypothetical protein
MKKQIVQYKKLIPSVVIALLLMTAGCKDVGEGWNDQRYYSNYELSWDNPNPKTGLPYTEEELAALKYDPTKEERFKVDQSVVLSLLLSKQISEVKVIDGTNGEVLLTVTTAEKDGEKYRMTMTTSLEELDVEEGTSKILKFDIVYQDQSIGSVQFKVNSVLPLPPASEMLKGQWKFNDASNLTKATIGDDLVLAGNMIHTAIAGISGSDGAVLVDTDTYYEVSHELAAVGGEKVNNYTLIFDLNVPAASYEQYIPLLQTHSDNSADGATYIYWGGFWLNGLGSGGWYAASPDTWHRVVITAGEGDLRVYVDNEKAKGGSPGADGVHALELAKFLLFADNNGEDAPIRISEVMLCDITMTHEWITEDLPGVGEPLK